MSQSESRSDFAKVSAEIENSTLSPEARERALDALAFAESLHKLFKDNGMTLTENVEFNELENLVDALFGELGAAVLFLCEPSFARVPDMLRGVSSQLAKAGEQTVPLTIIKGFARVAKRIENTRQNSQQLAKIHSPPQSS